MKLESRAVKHVIKKNNLLKCIQSSYCAVRFCSSAPFFASMQQSQFFVRRGPIMSNR